MQCDVICECGRRCTREAGHVGWHVSVLVDKDQGVGDIHFIQPPGVPADVQITCVDIRR